MGLENFNGMKKNKEMKKAFAVNGSLENGFNIKEIETSEKEMKNNQFTFETLPEAENFIKELKKTTNEEEKE